MLGKLMLGTLLAGYPVLAAGAPGVELLAAADGTPVALVEDHRAPLVTLRLEWPLGDWSAWPLAPAALDGFEAQRFDAAGRVRPGLDRLGVELTLATGPRRATLEATFLRDDLDAVLALLGEMLRDERFDRAELRRRRREERLGWRFELTDPAFLVRRALAGALFAPEDPRLDPYRPPRGSAGAKELARARDALLRVPGRAAGFAGDLDAATARRALAALLPPADGPAPDGATRLLPLGHGGGERLEISAPKLTQVYFGYGRDSLPLDDMDYPAFLVADHVLGGHFHSRLNEALRHEGGETYGAWTSSLGDVTPNLYLLSTFTRADNADAAEAKLRRVLERFHADGITEEERATAAAFLLGRLPFARQAPRQILARWLRERELGLAPGALDAATHQAAALDLAAVNALIRSYYDPARFTLVVLRPGS